MTLCMKREWKKCNDSSKNNPGHPETTNLHEIHNVTFKMQKKPAVDGLLS